MLYLCVSARAPCREDGETRPTHLTQGAINPDRPDLPGTSPKPGTCPTKQSRTWEAAANLSAETPKLTLGKNSKDNSDKRHFIYKKEITCQKKCHNN